MRVRGYLSVKAVGLGLMGSLAICALAYPNDFMFKSTPLIGNNLPLGVFLVFFLFSLVVRPLSSRLPNALRFTNRELVVSFVIMLGACAIPTSGLMRYFPHILTAPYDIYSTRQNWQTHQVLRFVPDHIVPEGWYIEGEDAALDATMDSRERREKLDRAEAVNKGFRNGLTTGTKAINYWPSKGNQSAIHLIRVLHVWCPDTMINVRIEWRLRFTWWLIHPVLFLSWGTWAAGRFAPSFLLGAVVKQVTVTYGGGAAYHRLKPFFMGAILGEVITACAVMTFNSWYYLHTAGVVPRQYFMFPY